MSLNRVPISSPNRWGQSGFMVGRPYVGPPWTREWTGFASMAQTGLHWNDDGYPNLSIVLTKLPGAQWTRFRYLDNKRTHIWLRYQEYTGEIFYILLTEVLRQTIMDVITFQEIVRSISLGVGSTLMSCFHRPTPSGNSSSGWSHPAYAIDK